MVPHFLSNFARSPNRASSKLSSHEKSLEHSKLKNLLLIRNDLWWKRSPSLMPEVKVARLREDRGDVIVRSGLWHGWWKTSEGSPTKIQLKKPKMIASCHLKKCSSKFKFYSRIAAFVVKTWQAKQRPLKQPEQKCLEAQMTAKKFYFVTEFWWDVFDFLTLAAKSFSLRKLFQSGKFWIRTKVSSLIYLSLDSKKGHLKPTNSFQVRKSPEQKVLNLLKSHFYEKKI